MRTKQTTNSPAAAAYAAYLATLHARPRSTERTIEAARQALKSLVTWEANRSAPGTGHEVALGVNKRGEPVTSTGKPVGTPYAFILVAYGDNRGKEIGKLYDDGDLETPGPDCFTL